MTVDASVWRETLGEGLFRGTMAFHEPMKRHTTLGIGGEAEAWMVPSDVVSFGNVLAVAAERGEPVTVVGAGSNLLVLDGGVPGVVLATSGLARIETIAEDEDSVGIFAEAGVSLARLLSLCSERGFTGIEGLVGIPGTLGGAVRMNAGAYGDEISSVLESVALMSPEAKLLRVKAAEIPFGYRQCGLPDDHVIVSANLRLRKAPATDVARKMRDWRDRKKADQPLSARSAGSVFKNPASGAAWKLVDEAGFRGSVEGGIRVSRLHANFFVNEGGGTATDFLRLVDRVRAAVKERCGIELELEIRVVGVPPGQAVAA